MRAEKLQMLEVAKGLIQGKPVFLFGFRALTVADFMAFRAKLETLNAECHVVKNSLIRKAAEALGMDALAKVEIQGSTVLVSGSGDPVAMAKAVTDLIKDTIDAEKKPKVAIKLGYLDGQLLSADDVKQLAELPPREVLLAQLLGLLQAPASQLVRVLNAKLSSVVYVLNAFLNKKEQAA